MGLMDALRAMGNIPRRLNEARFNHQQINAPGDMMDDAGGDGMDPDSLVTIGTDPSTGKPITIPQSALGNYGYDPASGQVMKSQPQSVRTGPSRFGNFVSQGLPRMLDAGIAAATAPGNGQGGVLAAMRGMDIGGDRLAQRDAIAANMRRQALNDESMADERSARAEERRMRAQQWEAQMNAPPKPPTPPAPPATWEAALVRRWNETTDPNEKNSIADLLNALKSNRKEDDDIINPGGGNLYDRSSGQWLTPPAPSTPKLQARGKLWKDAGDGYEEEYDTVFNPETQETTAKLVTGSRRRIKTKPAAAGRTISPTTAKKEAVNREASALLAEAGQNVDRAISLARTKNASIEVQNALTAAKRASRLADPPPPRTSGAKGAGSGAKTAWEQVLQNRGKQ